MIVVLLVVDSLRADAPGFAGGAAETPLLDKLAEQGTNFKEMYASGAWTVPSVMSMLTGSLGHKVGVCRWRHPFPAGRPTLMTAFDAAGFEVSCFHPYPRWGLLTVAGKGKVGNSQDPAAVRKALSGRKGQDRFVLIHHWWTHLPYINSELSRPKWYAACDFAIKSLNHHPERLAKKTEELYLSSLAHFSREILAGYLDAATAGGEDVLLALTGDHGETWGKSLPEGRKIEHVFDLHGRWITDETIRVPLLFYGKGADGAVPAGRSLAGMASGVDIAPTLAELAGVPWPGPIPVSDGPEVVDRGKPDLDLVGVSLASCVTKGRPVSRKEALTVSSHNTHVPDTYPDNGRLMWRTFALRKPEAWYVWDGVEQERTVRLMKDQPVPSEKNSEKIFQRLEACRQSAVDSAPIVEDKYLDELRDSDLSIKKQLRGLGYLD